MDSERARAYGRTMRSIEGIGRSKLHTEEQDTIREAADALLFCEDLEADPGAQAVAHARAYWQTGS